MTTLHLALAILLGLQGSGPGSDYKTRIAQWRQENEAALKREGGWLSVAGLYWLKEGDNRIGSDPSGEVVLPGSAPKSVGILTREKDRVTLRVDDGVPLTVNGRRVSAWEMKPDSAGSPDKAVIGDLTFTVIRRGARIGVRLYDLNAESRKRFTGEKWYAVDPRFVIHAKFTPYNPPKTILITNVLGDTTPSPSPGYVTFTLHGKQCRLDAEASGGGLFFNFQDATTGRTTYPAGRFLDAPKPEGGYVTLDFNQATNPPCAFTKFATCPLPPKGNVLPVAILAGEKTYHLKI